MLEIPNKMCLLAQKIVFIPRRSQKDIVFASSVRPSAIFRSSRNIFQYLFVRFDALLV